MELIDIVRELEPRLLQALSAIMVEFDGQEAHATLSINLPLSPGFGSKIGPYEITVDTDNLPEGVSFTGIQRYPDIHKALSTGTPMEEQIRALHQSNIVGGLDVARFDGGAKMVRRGFASVMWVIKTHAASEKERKDWLLSLTKTGHL